MIFNESFERIQNGLWLKYSGKPKWLQLWDDDKGRMYSDVVELEVSKLSRHFVSFMSCGSNEIEYIARARKEKQVVTGKTKIVFEDLVKLESPISIADILAGLSAHMQNSFLRLLRESVSTVTVNQYNAIITYIHNNRRSLHEELRPILHFSAGQTGSNNKEIIRSYEKEAINLSLRMAGLDSDLDQLMLWNQNKTSTPEFLRSASTIRMREDQMIINDFRCFGDWDLLHEYINNVAVFSNGPNRISIMNVNRTPIETTLGVDLFYYNEDYNSYIFVQYKRLTGDGSEKKFRFRGDPQFDKDILRMTSAETLFQQGNSNCLSEYRLSDEMFYFKFCKDIQEIRTKGLCTGMYLPKSYITKLIHTGAESLSYDTVGRYFTNTQFIENIKSGFFGSAGLGSYKITELLSELINSGRSIILCTKVYED